MLSTPFTTWHCCYIHSMKNVRNLTFSKNLVKMLLIQIIFMYRILKIFNTFLKMSSHLEMSPYCPVKSDVIYNNKSSWGICSCNWTSSQSMKLGLFFPDEKLFTVTPKNLHNSVMYAVVVTKKCKPFSNHFQQILNGLQ